MITFDVIFCDSLDTTRLPDKIFLLILTCCNPCIDTEWRARLHRFGRPQSGLLLGTLKMQFFPRCNKMPFATIPIITPFHRLVNTACAFLTARDAIICALWNEKPGVGGESAAAAAVGVGGGTVSRWVIVDRHKTAILSRVKHSSSSSFSSRHNTLASSSSSAVPALPAEAAEGNCTRACFSFDFCHSKSQAQS